jgi:hypothetical protein
MVEVVTPSASLLAYYTGSHFWYPSPRFSEASRVTAGSGGSVEPAEGAAKMATWRGDF